jgi:exosome complex exonuclease RRP6
MADIDPESFTKDVLAEAIKTTKLSSALPLDESEYDYYINFPGYKTFCCRIGSRINKLINKVIQYEQVPVSWPPVNRDELASPEIIEEQFDNLVEANDILLERISNYLDQATKGGSDAPPIGANVGVANEAGSTGEDVSVALWNKKKNKSTQVIVPQWRSDIPRPQSRFKDMVDNSLSPFVPHIRHKPNAIKPLPTVYTELQKPSTLQALIENARKWAESSERWLIIYSE